MPGGALAAPQEWKNFHMSRESFYIVAFMLRSYIKRQDTKFRLAVPVDKQLALTLYYLSNEGRLRKTANAFGLLMSLFFIIIRE